MRWTTPDHARYFQYSEDQRYSVCKIGNYVGTKVYESWRTRKHPSGLLLIRTNLGTAKDARRVCDNDCSGVTP